MTALRTIMYKVLLPAIVVVLTAAWFGSDWLRSLAPRNLPSSAAAESDRTLTEPSTPGKTPSGERPPATDVEKLNALPGATPAETASAASILTNFNAGNFASALKTAEDALNGGTASPAYRTWIKAQLPTLLTSHGWLLLKQNQCDQAVGYLSRAERLQPNPEATKGLAVCLYKLHDIPAASDKFAAYVTARPQDVEMQLLYADALESDQRFAESWSVLDKLAQQPMAADLMKVVVRRRETMAAKNRESSQQATTGTRHFVISYRSAEHRALASRVVEILERAHDEFANAIGTTTLQTAIEVSLYPNREFRDLTGGPSWADGLFDGRIRIPVPPSGQDSGGSPHLTRVIRHELIHALLAIQSDYRALPPWFNEGLAQTMECEGRRCGFTTFPPMPGSMLGPDILQSPFVALGAAQATQAYAQSRYLVATAFQEWGDDLMRQCIEGITATSSVSSDGILRPAGIDFATLLLRATDGWNKRRVIP